MAEITNGDPSRKELYRLLYNDKTPGVGDKVKKYSFSQFENKLLTDENVQDKIGSYLMEKGLVEDLVDFQGKYISTKPAPAPTAAPVAPVQQVVEPPVGIAAPKAIQEPTPSVTDYAREMAFEPQVETPVKPIGVMAPQPIEEPIPSVTETAREMAFKPPVEPKKPKEKERGFMEWTGDVFGTISAGGERIAKNILAGIGHYAQAQAATDPMASLPYEKRQQMLQEAGQTMYDIADAAQKEFQNEVAKRNIETSVLQAIDKKQYKNIPEAVLYTVGDAAMQIIPSVLTMGGSTYLQTLPAAYRDGVEAIAKEKGISPEQVIASGDDAIVVAGISSGFQSALENIGAGQVSKAIASKGAYKAIRDWLLKQNVNKNLARGAALLGVGVGEGTTEYIQEGTGQTGVIAAKSPTAKAFFERLPNELFTAEAEKQRRESFVGGLIGGGGLAGVGQAITKAFEKPPVAPQPPVASEAPVAPEAPIVPPAAPPVAPIEEAPVEEVTTPETGMFAGIEGPTEEAPATSGLFEGITGPPQEAPVAAEEVPVAAEEVVAEEVPAPAPKGKKGVTIEFPTKLSVGEVKPYAEVPDNYYRPDQQLKFNQGNYYEPVRVIAHPDVIRAISIGSKLGKFEGKKSTISDADIEFAGNVAKKLGYTSENGEGSARLLSNAVKDLAKENRSKNEEVFMVIGNEAKAPKPAPVTPPAAPKAEPKEEKPTTGMPQEGSKVNLPPQSKYTTEPRKMVFKDGQWKQEVGGEIVSVGEPVQKQAQEAFSGKTEAKAEETKPAPKAPETKGAEEEKPIHTETDKKGRVSKFFEKKQTKPDGTTVTRFEFERSDKGNERITATTGVPVEVALGDKWVIDDTYVPKGAKVIKIVEIREGDGNVRATVIFEAEDGTRFDGEVVLFEKGKPKGKPSKEAAIPEEPTQKGVRFEKGSKLTEEEKREVYKTLKDSYKEMGRPYTMEIRTSQYTGRDYEARVWLEKASDFMETSDVTGRKLRYYISLPDGTIAHPTELFPNVSASEMNAAQRSIEYNQRVAMQKMDDITSQLKKSGEIDKVVSAIALALENGAVFEKEYDSGDVGQKDAAVYLRFPNGAIKTIPDYVISTKEELLGFNRQDLDKYKSGDSKEKIFSTVYQPDWEQFYNENKSAETKPAETKPTAEFTSKQEGNASTEFDGTKKPSKIKMKTFDNKYGKGAFERMQNITQNFEDIMDGLSEKIKQDCL